MTDEESVILAFDNGDLYSLDTGDFLALTG